MAVFNEILVGRFNRALQKLVGIKGGPPSRQLGSEIMPTFCFPWGVELRYIEGWNTYSYNVVLSGSPANTNMVQLRNPAASNVVAVFVKCAATAGAAADGAILSQGRKTTDLSTPNPAAAGQNMDPRSGATARSALVASIQQPAGAAPGLDRAIASMIANSTYDFILDVTEEIPLLPGDAISIRNTNVNVGSNYTFWWRERALEDSELF
jgi:hypothetical protein